MVLAAACLFAAGSCDGSSESSGDDDDGHAAGGSGAVGATGGSGNSEGLTGGFSAGGGTPSAAGCSADLQKTTDANGNIVATCPPDQGCFEGECIPACEAAASSRGSIGCEYWAPTPPFYVNEQGATTYSGACFAVFVANTWGRSAALTVRYEGAELDASTFAYIPSGIGAATTYTPLPADGLPPSEVAVLFLAHRPGVQHSLGFSLECPRTPAVLEDTAVHNSGKGEAFEVITDTPVTAYDILPYGGAQSFLPSASLLFPRTAWGTNYSIMGPHPEGGGALWTLLVGTVDNTTLQILPQVNLPAGANVSAAPAGQTTTLTINAGEIVQWMGADPTSAIVQTDNPVGVWTGNTYLRVTSGTSSGGGQDAAHQQIAHVGALGNEYVGGGVVTRLASSEPESVPYRLMGVVDDTQLTWDPAPPSGAPTTLAAGQVVELLSTSLFSVRSQDEEHPFALSMYMPGTQSGTRQDCGPTPPIEWITCGLGDEEWVLQLPPRQFLQRYVFFTDPTYATTNLVVTRVASSTGAFHDVDVACLGTVTGWQPVGAGGQFEVAHVDLSRAFSGVTAECASSRHEATSDGAFGVTVWGTDYYASYGYPAGGNIGTINEVVVPPVPR